MSKVIETGSVPAHGRVGSVLVAGAGGLGTSALKHLVSSGVSRVGICDFDRVELSNLPRQLLYRETDIGRLKTEVAREVLERLPGTASVDLRTHEGVIRGDEEFIAEYEVVIDALDRADAKLVFHDHLRARGLRLVHAAATGWVGQGLTITGPGCLRCLFGDSRVGDARVGIDAPDCRRAGIVGPVVGLLGLLAADEAVRLLDGRRGRWQNAFWTFDGLAGRTQMVKNSPRADCPICGAFLNPKSAIRNPQL